MHKCHILCIYLFRKFDVLFPLNLIRYNSFKSFMDQEGLLLIQKSSCSPCYCTLTSTLHKSLSSFCEGFFALIRRAQAQQSSPDIVYIPRSIYMCVYVCVWTTKIESNISNFNFNTAFVFLKLSPTQAG